MGCYKPQGSLPCHLDITKCYSLAESALGPCSLVEATHWWRLVLRHIVWDLCSAPADVYVLGTATVFAIASAASPQILISCVQYSGL